jgi:F-type H+-transporting ATPase subunit gamma
MATLREIRTRISSVRSTQQITKAMKMVAAAKLRKAQENIEAIRPYAYELRDLIAHLSEKSSEVVNIPLIQKRSVEKILLVGVTADRGLCGAFNSNIIRTLSNRIKEYHHGEADIYLVGNKGYDFFKRRQYHIASFKTGIFNSLKFENALEVARELITLYENGTYDRIEIVYNEFKSAVQQNVIVEQFLPFEADENANKREEQIDFLYEPDKISILNQLIPKDLNTQIWRILLESNAAEHGARMTAMESATDNADEIVDRLTIFYNRSRQAAITKEISEIVGGAEALNG